MYHKQFKIKASGAVSSAHGQGPADSLMRRERTGPKQSPIVASSGLKITSRKAQAEGQSSDKGLHQKPSTMAQINARDTLRAATLFVRGLPCARKCTHTHDTPFLC